MIKLTRLNKNTVAVNPDHISWVDEVPDTTLCLIGGERLIVRETLDELLSQLVAYRRLIRAAPALSDIDLPPIDMARVLRRSTRPPQSDRDHRSTRPPQSGRDPQSARPPQSGREEG